MIMMPQDPSYPSGVSMVVGVYIGPEYNGSLNLEGSISNLPFPVEIRMPCGALVSFKENKDFPRKTVPCRCGDPKHFEVMIQKGVSA